MNETPKNYESTQESGPVTTEWDSLTAVESTADVAPNEQDSAANETVADQTSDYSAEQPEVAVNIEGTEETFVVPEVSNPVSTTESAEESTEELANESEMQANPETESTENSTATETPFQPESDADADYHDEGIDRPLDIDEYTAEYEKSLEENSAETPATEDTAAENTAIDANPAESAMGAATTETDNTASDSQTVDDEFMPQANADELPAAEQETYVETLTEETTPTPEA